jgi:hypothetical protein
MKVELSKDEIERILIHLDHALDEIDMNIKRYLNGKVSFHYSRWDEWKYIGINRFMSGRLIYLHLGKFSIQLDCR